ncbi:5'-3' exonuclease [Sediminivirga luteola]|uniref:5'-3' exonuclease n=1 Tax=Sediminivirga luteola TaxID=1774748 RepID=A0A8J2U080_9MICO|nr:5'-3' exonuclease H3TH domain-containing protein [Sediminivirga luteola]MCI2264050.1 helix-hairpin-helix domain-containing protein [Sediminivirga luteola]GGA22750.1 5'-3' exonuclease [Sediminivirga luteola]
MNGPLLALDTPALYYRAFYALPSSLRSPSGAPIGAVRGLLDMLAGIIGRSDSARVVAAFDADWRPAFRTGILPEYKAARVRQDRSDGAETPDDLEPQVPLLRRALTLAGIPLLEQVGHEADDVLGTLAAEARQAERELIVVTGDRDLFALVGGAVRVLYPGKQIAAARLVDDAVLAAEYGVPGGPAYREAAALRGDSSDGLSGVPGIGEKTAAQLIAAHGDLESVLAAAARAARGESVPGLTPRRAALLTEHADLARRTLQVMTTVDDLPLGFDLATPLPAARDRQGLLAFAEQHGFGSAATRLLAAQDDALAATAGQGSGERP